MKKKDNEPVLRIHTIPELLAAVPPLLGFHPTDSLVVVIARDQRVKLTCRIDFPVADHVPVASLLRQLFRRFPGSGGFLVAYTEHPDPWPLLERLTARLPADPLWVVQVGRGIWRQDCATGPTGSYQGQPDPVDPLPASRDELAKAILPNADESELTSGYAKQHQKLRRIPESQWRSRMRDLLDSYDPAEGLTPAGCARAAVLLTDSDARDAAVAAVTKENAARMLQLWLSVVRHCPEAHSVHPLCLLSLAAWVDGQGALANIARERAEKLLGLSHGHVGGGYPAPDPEVPALVGMLSWFHYHMVEPACWEELRSKALAQIA
jgi:hypothetical protein